MVGEYLMYEHAARGPFNSFVYPAPFSIPKFETEDKKEWSIGNSGDPFVIEKAPLTCRHKPRITKINGKYLMGSVMGITSTTALRLIISSRLGFMQFLVLSITRWTLLGAIVQDRADWKCSTTAVNTVAIFVLLIVGIHILRHAGANDLLKLLGRTSNE
jgi:hypothetical protein